MNNLIINSLLILDLKNKKAKRVEFTKGINIITSDSKDGNDVGKSVLMKSIYHTMGADAIFDDKWTFEEKSYFINFSISGSIYQIYRNKNLFKIYNHNFGKLFSTTSRKALAEYLNSIFKFNIKLPNRHDDILEIAPPVFSYLLNYVDQDHMEGTSFSSFKGLGQYSGFKENVIYSHFGVFNDEYFELKKDLEDSKQEQRRLLQDQSTINNMLARLAIYLEGMDAPTKLNTLNIELEKSKEEYSEIVAGLKKVKNKLIELRNNKYDLEVSIEEVVKKRGKDTKYFKLIEDHTCLVCQQKVEDEIQMRIKQSNQLEDYYILQDEFERLSIDVDRELKRKEEEYQTFLYKLEVYENKLKIKESRVSDSLKHLGYIEAKENMLHELNEILTQLGEIEKDIKIYNTKIRKYTDLKTTANSLYSELMTESKFEFDLKEIREDKIKNIKQNYEARGSNKAISTIIWYFNLLKVKVQLNTKVLRFPVVLDSPNNVESDESKEKALFNLVFKDINDHIKSQLILSALGFNSNDYEEISIDNIIHLNNKKYSVLNNEDYVRNSWILHHLFDDEEELI
ncbi:hypothetical protein BS614_23405 [Paenibacillus xylanexedens]|uniref:hypothetical protein n=1 Tax=Paenibacillus xylanexedens TaxID=528191 RepID=UPI00093813E4|nr:hypothetical protein [Paenibacillus xylanexedens]APO46698.1 hypothetical protein BS614_23405 [Paenibacillus xylanexedens]